ncbi:MarR family winged helix-turn-helix transcriptional regulator [Pedobacter sandarakinus]|uniref:MarR family winged helix-turn-helix transcriptional regulator n=1 Tax=Pedobacter sandarakinus TaxID=353156 RepID=UPI002248263C|nr:MarR family transcriptional regulator [Pedobacter sandarakinus]MCX2573254.1 MarR family transcriptional regulator [Pedobacter sandarakinus]
MKQQQTLDYHVKFAWQNMFNKYNQMASSFGITQAIGYMLININDEEGTAVSNLAGLLGVKATSLSRMLNNMEEANLIFRETAAGDKRSVKVFLTDFGKEKKQLAKGVVRKFNEYLDEHFTKKEKDIFIGLLVKLNEITIAYTVD